MRIVGLIGHAGSGKDTVASIMCGEHGWRRVAFADPIRRAAYALDPVVPAGPGTWRLSYLVDSVGWDAAKRQFPEVRRILQRLGVEAGRDVLGEDVWVNLALQELADRTVIPDVRMPNEVRAIRDRGGLIVQVSRPGSGPVNGHPVERLAGDAGVLADFTLANDGAVTDLPWKVTGMLSHLGLSATV